MPSFVEYVTQFNTKFYMGIEFYNSIPTIPLINGKNKPEFGKIKRLIIWTNVYACNKV